MAIAHLAAKVVAAGRSPISAAAYRHRTTMQDVARDATVSYEAAGDDLAHEEIALPKDAPDWVRQMLDGRSVAKGSEALWTAVWEAEKRFDAQTAREVEIALPKELGLEQQIALMREFVGQSFTGKGMVADWVIHNKDGNPHAHLMHTLRPLAEQGFGGKSIAILGGDGQPLRANGKIVYRRFMPGGKGELLDMRQAWANVVNRHLALAGHDVRIDMRSYATQAIEITPTTHIGPRADGLALSGAEVRTLQKHAQAKAAAARDIQRKPEALLKKLGSQTSTFSERDIAKELARTITDPQVFGDTLARIRASAELQLMRPEVRDPVTNRMVAPAVFSTREVVRAEKIMAQAADTLAKRSGFAVRQSRVAACIARVETKNPAKAFSFDDEQKLAVQHVTGPQGVAAVVGFAGAGKSTLLEAANLAWVGDGRRVFGGALAGKAAEGLEESAGIASRTLASWELAWNGGRDLLQRGDVFVIDEAGMVGSLQLSRITQAIEKAGAKLVLVGDAMQLQPIEAGAAFRAITDRIGYAELVGIRRQADTWAQEASRGFARGQVADALEAYRSRGHWKAVSDPQEATRTIVADFLAARPEVAARAAAKGKPVVGNEMLILAHSNDAVYGLNQGVRAALQAEGTLAAGHTMKTERGDREFAIGDRMIFLKNEKFYEAAAPELGRQAVKNGMLATVLSTDNGLMRVRLDSGREVAFKASTYRNVDHGYAATVHKSQGVTVDRVFVYGTKGFDQHLSYVAMSRHRHQVTLYTAETDFKSFDQVVATMGRSGAKTTTLDYENEATYQAAANAFLHRRGIDTVADILPALRASIDRQRDWIKSNAEAVASLWSRAGAALDRLQGIERPAATIEVTPQAPTANTGRAVPELAMAAEAAAKIAPPPAAMINPYQGHAAVTVFAATAEADARRAVVTTATWAHAEALLRTVAAQVYADPDAAIAAIRQATTAPGAKAADLALLAADKPETFGGLAGGRGARAAAQDLAPHVRVQATMFAREHPAAIEQETQRRAAMATVIPALSTGAAGALRTIEAARVAGGDNAAANATRMFMGNASLSTELKTANDALTARFGWKAFGPKAEAADTDKAMSRVPAEERAALAAAAPAFAALRAFGNAAHFVEQRDAARALAEAQPLRPARIIPDLTLAEIDAMLRADAVGQERRAEAQQIAGIVYGAAKPIDGMLEKIAREPRAAQDVAVTIDKAAGYPAPLAGAMVGMFRNKPDAIRQRADDHVVPLMEALSSYGNRLGNLKADILAARRTEQSHAKVEIPAPSPRLAEALRPDPARSPADAFNAAAKVAADPVLAAELRSLNKAMQDGLPHADRRLLAKGDTSAVAERLRMTPTQAARIVEVAQRATQLTTDVEKHLKVFAQSQKKGRTR